MARVLYFETASLLVSSYTFRMMTALSEGRECISHHRNFLVGNIDGKKSFLVPPPNILAMVEGQPSKMLRCF